MQMEKDTTVYVYVGEIPARLSMQSVYPKARQTEIEACKNERVRQEKYCAWKLLQYALYDVYGKKMDEYSWTKTNTGKWLTDSAFFSISHTKNVVVVAISAQTVGVDVEGESAKLLRVLDKILSRRESEKFMRLAEREKLSFLLNQWTKKEAVFKAFGDSGFVPREIETNDYSTWTDAIRMSGNEYLLSVAGEFEKVCLRSVGRYLET